MEVVHRQAHAPTAQPEPSQEHWPQGTGRRLQEEHIPRAVTTGRGKKGHGSSQIDLLREPLLSIPSHFASVSKS